MKKLTISMFLGLTVTLTAQAGYGLNLNNGNTTQVNGYFKSNGTYVSPHVRTYGDSATGNNYNSYQSESYIRAEKVLGTKPKGQIELKRFGQ